jgi:adenylosuccinate synthase
VILPPGAYIDVALLQHEIREIGLSQSQLIVDPRAHIIRHEHVEWEREALLTESIGSTGSGTGAAVISRAARMAPEIPPATLAGETPDLSRYIQDTSPILRRALTAGERILIEGTQGFGLSAIHGEAWPKVTSRDTTAAGFLAEAGLSPLDVDQIILVIRCHPIRVAGDSGPLAGETDWQTIATGAHASRELGEFTSVTKKLRRVGQFAGDLVRMAIATNSPTTVVLNHLDYVDWSCRDGPVTEKAAAFVRYVEREIGRHVDMVGTSETRLFKLDRQVLV